MNKNLKTFLIKTFLLLFLIFGSIETFYQLNPYKKNEIETSYYATIIEKHTRLKTLKSPKIVLMAGSNFAYGINSEMIEKAFNQPVVNMAIQYDFGTDFMLKQLENELKQGDLVILGFEYIVDSKGKINDKLQLSTFYPEAKNWFGYEDLIEYFKEHFKLRISALKLYADKIFNNNQPEPSVDDTENMFFRRAINQYGDLISHFNNPSLTPIPRAIIDDKKSLIEPIEDINIFYEKMRKKGIKVVYVFPSYAQSSYNFDKPIIKKLEIELRKNAKFPILGKPNDFVFADSLCQDMVYHLNKTGRDIRTEKLIEILKKTTETND